MPTPASILCATDFSPSASVAEQAAAAVAKKAGLPLHLVHVLDPSVEVLTDLQQDRTAALLEDRLARTAKELEAITGAPVKFDVRRGQPASELRAAAAVLNAKLVVVASQGHGASSMLRLGGTSERLAAGTEVPVLVVREADSFTAWAKGAPLRVLLALQEDEAGASALRWLKALREAGPVDVVVSRVYYANEAHLRYGLGAVESPLSTDSDREVEALIERDLKRLVPALPGEGALVYRAKRALGRVAEHILDLAEAERCQLIVVGSHGRTGLARLWSVSSTTLHLSRVSVAVIPPDGAGVLALPPRLSRILVTTDFSPLAAAAIPWAYAMAWPGAEVVLAHVLPPPDELRAAYEPALPEALSRAGVERELSARLRELVPREAAAKSIVTRTQLLHAIEPAKAILTLAEHEGTDAIVMSSHGRTGVVSAVYGSVAQAVLRGSARPVLVVRP